MVGFILLLTNLSLDFGNTKTSISLMKFIFMLPRFFVIQNTPNYILSYNILVVKSITDIV